MSMYGGFEQVGSIGKRLPREDKQTVTEAAISFYTREIRSLYFTDRIPGHIQSLAGKRIKLQMKWQNY